MAITQHWKDEYDAPQADWISASPYLQDNAVDDTTTGVTASFDGSGLDCLEPMDVGITAVLDFGGVVDVAEADTWRYSGSGGISHSGVVSCAVPPEHPSLDGVVLRYTLSASVDAVSWHGIDSYFGATGVIHRNGTFSGAVFTSMRYLRLTVYGQYWRVNLSDALSVAVTDMRCSVSAYSPPTIPPPTGVTGSRRDVTTQGTQSSRCIT